MSGTLQRLKFLRDYFNGDKPLTVIMTHNQIVELLDSAIKELTQNGANMNSAERAAFEKWAESEFYSTYKDRDGSYLALTTKKLWEGWQARAQPDVIIKQMKDAEVLGNNPILAQTKRYRDALQSIVDYEVNSYKALREIAQAALKDNQQKGE